MNSAENIIKLENYLVIILVILNSTVSTTFTGNNIVFHLLSVLLIYYIFVRRKLKHNKLFFLILFVSIVYSLIYFIKFQSFNPLFTIRTLLKIYIAYLSITILRYHYFRLLENTIYKLALISILIYPFQILSFNFLFTIIHDLQNIIPFLERTDTESAYIIIYGLQKPAPLRNSGFMWEPGAFAAMLLIPIALNLINYKYKVNRKLIIMIIALITTFSTMGYIGLVIIIFWWIYNSKATLNIILVPILIVVIVIFYQLDFMTNKIISNYENKNEAVFNAFESESGTSSLGRFGSLIMDIKDWKRNPFIGIGGQDEEISKVSFKLINRTNGLSSFLLRFGIVGIIFILIGFYNTFKHYLTILKGKGTFYLVLIICILSFSNNILITPLFISYTFWGFIIKGTFTHNMSNTMTNS